MGKQEAQSRPEGQGEGGDGARLRRIHPDQQLRCERKSWTTLDHDLLCCTYVLPVRNVDLLGRAMRRPSRVGLVSGLVIFILLRPRLSEVEKSEPVARF